jgi:short-chain fatty acids transporter
VSTASSATGQQAAILPSKKGWLDAFARAVERLVPDAITTSILLMVVLTALSVVLGHPVTGTIDAYYRGLWNLLSFTMQMTLILVLSLILGATPLFRGAIEAISRLPRTRAQVVVVAVLLGGFVAYLNWGLSIALSPVIAIHCAREAERKGIAIDFLFLLATLAGAGSVWQFGFSASAPLLMATPGHFLEKTTGVMPLSTTIWSPAAIVLVVTFTLAVMVVGYALMPKEVRPISEFLPDGSRDPAPRQQSTDAGEPLEGLARRLEHSRLVMAPLWLMLVAWIHHHFFVKGLSLDINSVNTIVLLLGTALHGTVFRFTQALQDAVARAWPIVLMYHLYAGVAGLIQFTPVGDFLIHLFTPILTQYSYPLLTVVISTVVATFIPTSGGQWLIQGFVTVETAAVVGLTPQRGLLALSVGDHMGNLIAPFWAVVGASIAKIDFRLYFGYRLIFAVLWFTLGVLAFTFLPC